MELSFFLAKTIGVSLALIALSMILNRKNIGLLFDAYRHPAAVYITGFLETFLGISLVVSHSVWEWDFRVIITLLGWILLVRGAGRLLHPEATARLLASLRAGEQWFVPVLYCILLLGVYLAYAGFTG